MYTKLEEAIHFVFKAFQEKRRLKEDIDLSFHSISVGMMLLKEGYDEETVLTGFLHDIIEDTNYTYENLREKFGEKIARNVVLLSEDKSISEFEERKEEFISRLWKAPERLILIELVDKLHNLVSDYELYLERGESVLETRFATYEMNKWYYLKMLQLFESRIPESNLLPRYQKVVNIYFKEKWRKNDG